MLLALDFGGTKLSAAVWVAGERTWRGHRRVFSPPGADAAYDIRTIVATAVELLDGRQPAAIGVSFGGPVDFAGGVVRLSHHVPGWENIPLRALLEAELGAPTAVDNDANVAALGEHRFGAGRGYDSLFYLTVSTGVGGGWILNGRPWRGAEGMAGEIGHMVVDPAGPLCLCGKQGCVERLASGPYMAEDARRRLAAEPARGHILRAMVGAEVTAVTGQTIAQAATQGDELAWSCLERGAWALGTAIGNSANLINPQLFVLGGGVTKSGDRWWQTIRQTARATALPEIHFDIVTAVLGDDAPLWGAVALAGGSGEWGVGEWGSGGAEEQRGRGAGEQGSRGAGGEMLIVDC
jgi:glucokinase